MEEFEDETGVMTDFLFRITARQALTLYLFMEQLSPEQRMPIRQQGFTTARVSAEELLNGALVTLGTGLKPLNARRISVAMNDTRDVWVGAVLPKDRPQILDQIAKAQKAVKDDEAQKNLAAFGAALATAK